MKRVTRVSLSLFLLLSSFAVAGAATLQAKVTEVSSGNTVVVSNINRALRIRLKGIAPPEAGQPFSEAAREHLKMLVMDKTVMVDYSNLSDGYIQAKISLNQIDIGSQMLRDGVAWYDRSSDFTLNDADRILYAQCEEAARAEKRGLWSDQNAVAPWAFRRKKDAQLAKIETGQDSTFAATQSTKRRKAAAPAVSTSDLFGNVFGGGGSSSAGAPAVRPVSENGTPDRWVKFDSPREHFSISVPSNSVEGSFGLQDKTGSASFHFLTGGSSEGFFIFVSAVGPQMPLTSAEVSDQMIQNLIAGMNDGASKHGEHDLLLVIKSSRAVSLAGISGKDYTLRAAALNGTARVLTRKVGEAQEFFVMLSLTRAGNESLGSRFINSFKLQ